MLVQFTKKYRPFNAGEVAELPDKEALQLIRKGLAVMGASPVETVEAPVYHTAVVDTPNTVVVDAPQADTVETTYRRPGRPPKNRG